MIEVSLDDFVRAHPIADPRSLQRSANTWLAALRGDSFAPRLHVEGLAVDLFDALRSQILLRTGQAFHDAALLETLREVHPAAKVRVTGRLATPQFARLARVLKQDWVEVPSGMNAGRLLDLAYLTRQAARRTIPAPTNRTQKPQVIAVPRMAGHLADLVPVCRALEQRGEQTGWVAPALSAQLGHAGLLELKLGGVREALLKAALLRVRAMRVAHGIRVDGLRYPAAARYALSLLLTEQLLDLVWFASAMARLLIEVKPRIVLVGNPYTVEGRVSARLASALGVASACIEHGTIFADDPIWEDCPVDRVLVWGEPSRDALLTCGVAGQAIAIVGAPRLDPYANASFQSRGRSVLVATSGPGDQVSNESHAKFIELLFEAAEALPDVEFVIKLHPKDSERNYQPAKLKRANPRIKLLRGDRSRQGIDIFEFLAGARVLVTIASTTALDAMAVGVPVVTVLERPIEEYGHIEFLVRGCTTRVNTSSQLAAALALALDGKTDPKIQAAAQAYAGKHYANRGQAAVRAADELIRFAAERSAHA
jgi:glycosyltransferase involved in cell wall biosynthesis